MIGSTPSNRVGARRLFALAGAALLAVVGCERKAEPAPGSPTRRVAEALPPAAASPEPSPTTPSTRNVLLITIDTLRADALGAYGNPLGASPGIDRLAAAGVVFEQCSSSSPSTLPSHASIFTGSHPFSHGARANARHALAKHNVTLAERLREAGHVTGAEVAAVVLSRHTQLDQGFDHYRDVGTSGVVTKKLVGADGVSVDTKVRAATDITRRGLEFLRDRRHEPFFLWLHYFDPHRPYLPPPSFASRFESSLYHGEVAFVDEEVTRVIAELQRIGLGERTLVIVTSDHGEGLMEHEEASHSFFVFETTMHVPLILWGPPEVSVGARIASLVRTVDIAPTVLDWLGLDPLQGVEGRSLLPLLARDAPVETRAGYGESIELRTLFGAPILRFLRAGSWKYIHKARPELYDLDTDPGELRNLAASESGRVEELRERMRSLLAAAPALGDGSTLDLDPQTSRQLALLGYVAGGPAPDIDRELDAFSVEGVDAAELSEPLARYLEAIEHIDSGRVTRGLAELEALAEIYPDSSPILERLSQQQALLGRHDELLETLRHGVRVDPAYRFYWAGLSRLLLARGDRIGAAEVLRGFVARWPCETDARLQLGVVENELDGPAAQVAVLEAGLDQCGEAPELLNDLADVLATAGDPEVRDGERAVRLAERALEALGEQPAVLDTLAAAYAESGRYDEAIETARRAGRLAETQQLPEPMQAVLRERLAVLEQRKPIRR